MMSTEDPVRSALVPDSTALLDPRNLYEIADLDRSRWTIVGIEAALGDTSERMVIYAADRMDDAIPEEDLVPGEIGVTAFHLRRSTRVDQFLTDTFQKVSLRLVAASTDNRPLRVVDHVSMELLPAEVRGQG